MEGLNDRFGGHRPSRRTVAAGAAWTLPAITFAQPAPAAACSLNCATLPTFTSTGWAVVQTGATVEGSGVSQFSGGNWNTSKDAALSTTYTAAATTKVGIRLLEGCTYTFTLPYRMVTWNVLPMTGAISIAPTEASLPTPTEIASTSTTTLSKPNYLYGTATYQFTPSATGDYVVRLTNSITSTDSESQGDDILWYPLQVSCGHVGP